MQKTKKNAILNSPKAPKYLKKTVKITRSQRKKLKRLSKKELQHLSHLAGEPIDNKDTKNIITHRLSRNKEIAIGLAAVSIPLLYLTLKKKNPNREHQALVINELKHLISILRTEKNDLKNVEILRENFEKKVEYARNFNINIENLREEFDYFYKEIIEFTNPKSNLIFEKYEKQ